MTIPDDAREVLAAEYVLGLTDASDRSTIEKMIIGDPQFATLVASWRARLWLLDGTAPPHPVDERMWANIEAALGDSPHAVANTVFAPRPRTTVAPAPGPAPTAARAPAAPVAPQSIAPQSIAPPPVSPAASSPLDAVAEALRDVGRAERAGPGVLARLWNSLAFWRVATLSGALAALLLAAGLAYTLQRASRQPLLIAVLMTEGNQAAAVVNAYADGRAELVPLVDIEVPQGKAIEIWTLWDRAAGPRSVGLISRAGRTVLRLDNLPKPQPGQLFEMTLEPATGSPTGRPTGPVLNKGNATLAL